jgi:hypothetical protein
MVAAKHHPALFHAMTNNPHPAMRTGGGKLIDGAFEAIKRIGFIGSNYLKRFIVIVSAPITFRHNFSTVVEAAGPIYGDSGYQGFLPVPHRNSCQTAYL